MDPWIGRAEEELHYSLLATEVVVYVSNAIPGGMCKLFLFFVFNSLLKKASLDTILTETNSSGWVIAFNFTTLVGTTRRAFFFGGGEEVSVERNRLEKLNLPEELLSWKAQSDSTFGYKSFGRYLILKP